MDVLLELLVIAVYPVWMPGVAVEVSPWLEVQRFVPSVSELVGVPL